MLDLMKAVYDRWVAASLHTSICPLYPAGDGAKSGQTRSGTPVETAMPRADYYVQSPPPSIKTRGSRTAQAVAVIRIWDRSTGSTDAATRVATHLQNIRAAFVNADESGMDMDNGDILEVDDGGTSPAAKEDDDVFGGAQTLIIRHRINNTAP